MIGETDEAEDADPESAVGAARRREVERLVDGSSALMADPGERARAWR